MSQTRRLAAILAADVAGYSRLMGTDEDGMLERLKALRHELLDPKIAEHRGPPRQNRGRRAPYAGNDETEIPRSDGRNFTTFT